MQLRAFSHQKSKNQIVMARSMIVILSPLLRNMPLEPEELHDLVEALKRERSRTHGPAHASNVLEAIISLCSQIAARAADGPVAQTARAMRASAITLYAGDKSAEEEIVRDLLEEAIAQLEPAVGEDRARALRRERQEKSDQGEQNDGQRFNDADAERRAREAFLAGGRRRGHRGHISE